MADYFFLICAFEAVTCVHATTSLLKFAISLRKLNHFNLKVTKEGHQTTLLLWNYCILCSSLQIFFFLTFFVLFIFIYALRVFLFCFFDYSGHTIWAPIITWFFFSFQVHLQKHCSQGVDLARVLCVWVRERIIYTFHFKKHLNVIGILIKPRKQPLITWWTQS